MTTKPSKTRRYVLADVIEREKTEHPSIEIEAGDHVFEVLAPSLWPDEVFDAAQAEDLPRAGRLLLGDTYDDYLAAGGTAALLFTILRDAQGASPGE